MSASGGPPVSISFNGREFKFAADATPTLKLGGFEKAYESNGDGSARVLMTRVTWMCSGCVVEADQDNDDFEALNDVQQSTTDVDVSVELSNGDIYVGVGSIVGELALDNSKATASFDSGGPGTLKKL